MALIGRNETINQLQMLLEAGFSNTGILTPSEHD